MRRILASIFVLSLVVAGCGGQQTVGSSGEAIDIAKTLQTTQEKVSYLMKQAEGFYKSQKFQEAVTLAQHVLSHLDADSAGAKALLEKAKRSLYSKVEEAAGDVAQGVSAKISGFGSQGK